MSFLGIMAEFEVRLFNREGTLLKTLLTDAASEKAALAKAATIAKKTDAFSFDVRQPLAQRWIKRSKWS